jgi:hypothetical protein
VLFSLTQLCPQDASDAEWEINAAHEDGHQGSVWEEEQPEIEEEVDAVANEVPTANLFSRVVSLPLNSRKCSITD